MCTPYNHAPCHFMQSHIRKVYASLAVTCHLHFWQNDRNLLRATAVTRGWNGYRNTSQHRKSTLEKKILPPLLQGLEPGTFQSRVRRSNHWAIPVPNMNSLSMLTTLKSTTLYTLDFVVSGIYAGSSMSCGNNSSKCVGSALCDSQTNTCSKLLKLCVSFVHGFLTEMKTVNLWNATVSPAQMLC